MLNLLKLYIIKIKAWYRKVGLLLFAKLFRHISFKRGIIMKKINESIYDFKPIKPVSPDKEFIFSGDPSNSELSILAAEIANAIITVAAGGLIYVRTDRLDQRGPYKIQLAKDTSRALSFSKDRCLVELKGEKIEDSVKPDTFTPRTFPVADILDSQTYLFVARNTNPNGKKYIVDTERTEKIKSLVNTYIRLESELDKFTKPERDAQEFQRQRRALAYNRNLTAEERMMQRLTMRIPGAADEQQKAILWLAAHVGTISASLKNDPKILRVFSRVFGLDPHTTPSVSIVSQYNPDGSKKSYEAKFTYSIKASLRNVTAADPIPDYFTIYGLLDPQSHEISSSEFLSRLIVDYGFEFGKYDAQKRQQLFNTLLKDFGYVDPNAEAEEAPLNQDFPDPVESEDVK